MSFFPFFSDFLSFSCAVKYLGRDCFPFGSFDFLCSALAAWTEKGGKSDLCRA